uniref:DUF1266 domain-containing protein n=1 Tax=Citrobacter sp. NCU1 TaxID=2026683 RepID=UPI001EE29AE9|nr:DUF1266 domain-containing protein [Citrobacter sp. NCU1]
MHLLLSLLVAILVILWKCKKAARRKAPTAQAQEHARLAERRRDTRRRKWALALADILILRNGLKTKDVTLALPIDEHQRQHLAQQVKKELGLAENLREETLHQQVADILQRWPAGVGKTPRGFYDQLAARGQVRDALAFDCARTAFLTRCIAGLGWCSSEQAWLVLFLNAQRAQDCFHSWEDYATAYVRARQIWLELHHTPTTIAGRDLQEVMQYLDDPLSHWRELPWNTFKIFELN